ncbi:tyrosine-type recombinase/integrase [Micromonospora globbae]|uniref:tyrosine-type recombinase/integrase n=1 Tax=Micromonospora globbae TaxID=1894969 RepID=UPI00343DD71A
MQRFLTGLRGKLAPASIIKVHAVLRVALADAERMNLVARNVAKAAKPPAIGRTERRALTPEEATRLLSALTGDRLASLFVLALATGLRRAELLGLQWSDVDLTGRAPFVRQTLQRTIGAWSSSRRRPTVPAGRFRCPGSPSGHWSHRECGRLRSGLRLVSCGRISAWSSPARSAWAMESRNVNRRFEQLREAAGLDWLHLHDLRQPSRRSCSTKARNCARCWSCLGTPRSEWARRRRHDRLAVQMAALGSEIDQGKCWWSPGELNP